MKPAIQSEVTVIHSSILSLFLLEFPGTFVVFMILVLVNDGPHDAGDAALFGLSFFVPMALLASWGLSRFYCDMFSAEGIQGHSFWGSRRFIRWQDIRQVRAFRLLHLRFLRLFSSADQKVTWIGLFPARPKIFSSEIQRLAPADSPVRKFVT